MSDPSIPVPVPAPAPAVDDYAEQCRKAVAELSSLNRVSHRLALVDTTERLQQVLDKLLPRLLFRIGDNHQAQLKLNETTQTQLASTLGKIHATLIETLSHTMKRVRDDASCQIPVYGILELLLEKVNGEATDSTATATATTIPQSNLNTVDPFTLNLSLAFLTLGLPRMKHANDSATAPAALLPGLLVLHGDTAGLVSLSSPNKKLQAHQIARLLLQCLILTATTVQTTTAASSTAAATDHIALARTVLAESPLAAACCFDLILDVLLYPNSSNNTSSSLPPDGLSQVANERFNNNWAAALAVGGTNNANVNSNANVNIQQVKLALLDLIAPHRQWALFVPNKTRDNDTTATSTVSNADKGFSMGLARTVALLVAASGDAAVEVSERATTSCKIHLDSIRGASAKNNGISTSTNTNTSAMGDPVQLACGLLTLCLGQTHAESILKAAASTTATATAVSSPILQTLGRTEQPTGSESSQLIFSTKRRPVSESTAAAILAFCSSKILDDHPTLLDDACYSQVACLGQLTLQVARKTLQGLTSASGLSALRAKPYIAAAQLLNSLCIRLTVYYDTNHYYHDNGDESESSAQAVADLLASCLSTACEVLSGAATQRPAAGNKNTSTSTSSAGNIAVRDACYGVICTLSRSRFALAPGGYVFTRGKGQLSSSSDSSTTKLAVSIETASLLFGCAANEEETLRPRAVAALDALLGAYCRVYVHVLLSEPNNNNNNNTNKPMEEEEEENATPSPSDASANPWATASTTATATPAIALDATDTVTVDRAGLAKALLPLIWTAAQTYQPKASRVAAARWSSDLLKELGLANACHIMCFLAGDSDVTASSIAREGLGLPKHVTEEIPTNADDSVRFPDFGTFTEMVFSSSAGPSALSLRLRRFGDFSPQGRAAALRFGLLCLLNDIYGGEDHAVGVYLSALTETLNIFLREGASTSSIDLLDESSTCLFATVSTSQYARKQLWSEKKDVFAIRDIERLCLKAASSRARRHLAGACGRMYEDSGVWECGPGQVPSLERWLSLSHLDAVVDATAEKLSAIGNNHLVASQIHGAAFLGAHAVRAFRLQAVRLPVKDVATEKLWDKLTLIFAALGRGLLHSDEIIGNACADGLGIAFSYDGTDAPLLDSRLYIGSAAVLNQLAAGLTKYGNGDSTDAARVVKLSKAAGDSLSASTSGSGIVSVNARGEDVGLGPARVKCADALFTLLGSMSFRKDEEIGLVAGEALACYADAYSPKNVVWGAANLLWPDDFSESFASQLPPHQHVIYVLLRKIVASSNPQTRTATAPALLALVARATKGVHSDDTYVSRSLVQSLLERLDEVQQVFIKLLSDPKSKHLSRESCCLGLAACRGLTEASRTERNVQSGQTSDELNQRLLRAFGQTTNYSGSAMMETSAQAAERRASEREASSESGSTLMETFGADESEVGGGAGGAGVMTEAALGAYKEMASASVAIGRADILYTLLMLSVSHPVWFSEGPRERYGASSLLGESSIMASRTNSLEMREALRPHIGKLLPRILRACHDPNKQTREQMSSLWVGLTGGGSESRLAITQHLLPAVDALIADSASKLWRARVGACGALTEIIVGREWDSLGGGPPVLNDDDLYGVSMPSAGIRLLRLWRTAMRSLDDVRGAVRDSGESLARAVRGLTIRLCDPAMLMLEKSSGAKRGREEQAKCERDATAAAATSLRWLIRHGLNGQAEGVGISISTLVEIVGVVRPKILGPILPDLLKSLLMAMSGLEPAALNFLQLRTNDQEGLERIRLQLAQSGPLATAVAKCLDLLPGVNIETQKAVIPQLDSTLRMSAGFATRAATADAVSTLCATCPDAFRFSGPASANPTVRLLRAFYFASERERGQGAKDKMIHAVGNLASLCPGSSVRSLAIRACERYNSSTGNSDDPASRRAAASALRAIAVRASNQFADGGNSDIWCRRVLPVAFIGRTDSDPKIAALWKEVWEEGGGAANASDTKGSFSSTLEETLLPYLVHECVKALKDVAWSRRVGAANALSDLCDQGILAPAPRSPKTSKVGDATASMARARHRAQASHTALHECLRVVMKPRLWTGKSQVLKATVKLASKWASGSVDGDVDETILFGWDGEASTCPWRPLIVSPGQFGNDLFAGDKWFLNTSMEDEPSGDQADDGVPDAMEVDEKDDSPINFEECDTILGDDDQNDSADDSSDDLSEVVTFTGLCRLLINHALQSTQSMSALEELPYRAASFHGFRDLLNCLPPGGESVMQRMEIYGETSAKLFGIFSSPGLEESEKKEPPVLVAGAINSLAACFWEGIGSEDTSIDNANALELATTLKELGGSKQPAWTVREASANCTAELASKCHADVLRQANLVSTMVTCAAHALNDRKFWKVRYSGLRILHRLTSRAGAGAAISTSAMATGSDSEEKQLTLEALLPHKEEMLRLVRSSLSDTESKVTALSSEILGNMVWWP